MKLRWLRCLRERVEVEIPEEPPAPTSLAEARAARAASEAGLAKAVRQWGPVRAVTASLRDHGNANHFAERLGEAFRERN